MVSRAAQFLPVKHCATESCYSDTSNPSGGRPMYDVEGIIGPASSYLSIKTASLFESFKVPQISGTATSNALSNIESYSYFSRITLPDKYQASVMIDLISAFNWTYITILYSEGSYGRGGYEELQRHTKDKGVCIAMVRAIASEATAHDFEILANDLVADNKSKVVVMFMWGSHMRKLANRLATLGAARQKIFICSDTFGPDAYKGNENIFLGTLAVSLRDKTLPGFEAYYHSLSPWRNESSNMWVGEYTPEDVGCIWANNINETKTKNNTVLCDFVDLHHFYYGDLGVYADSVLVFAEALDSLIRSECPEAFGNRSAVRKCVTGPLLLSYIHNVSFDGYVQHIEFDQFGDLIGGYDITFFHNQSGIPVKEIIGEWSRLHDGINIAEDKIVWYLNVKDQSVPHVSIPESVCARPCGVGQFYIQGELECCWECRHCRDNEYVREDQQGCETCPEFTWPHQDTFTTCQLIPPTFLTWMDSMAIGLLSISSVGILVCFLIAIIFIYHKDKKIIRGSSRELMTPITVGLLIAYLSVFAYIAKPQNLTCYLTYGGFHFSCTLIFGPLCLKTIRLYKIFAAAEKCKTKVSGVSGISQTILTLIIMFIQVSI